jgi:hypothetical protein
LRRVPYRTWNTPAGSPWTCFFHKRDGYLLRFPGLADFTVSATGRAVICQPVPGLPKAVMQHLYLNQVLPLALSRQDYEVFHASAVELDNVAVAFVGPSGFGKSTLAASFASCGHRFLTDDALVLRRSGERHAVIPSHPSLRLRDDACNALLPSVSWPVAAPALRGKMRFAAGLALAHCADHRALHRVYFLGEGGPGLTITRMGPAETFVRLLKNSFLLEIEERSSIAAHFDRLVQLAQQPVHFCLEYPRRFAELHRVRSLIARHARLQNPPDSVAGRYYGEDAVTATAGASAGT